MPAPARVAAVDDGRRRGRCRSLGVGRRPAADQRHVVDAASLGRRERVLLVGERREVVAAATRVERTLRGVGRSAPFAPFARAAVAATIASTRSALRMRLIAFTPSADGDLGELFPVLPVQLRTVEGVAHVVLLPDRQWHLPTAAGV